VSLFVSQILTYSIFSGESTNASSLVSPEQSVNGGAPPENGAVQAAQLISQHAAGIQQQHQKQTHHNHPGHIPVAPGSRPAPAPLAPAPSPHVTTTLAAQPPMVASHGISVPAGAPYIQQATHIAPAPSNAGSVNVGVAQQPGTTVTKRRRIDNPGSTGGNQVLADPMAVAAALQGRGRKKSQAQIDRRRERNRILARRTRLRKKFFFESLQKEVVDLQRENAALKDIVRTQLAEDGKTLLDECDALERMPAAVVEACGENAGEYDQEDFNLVRSIQQSQHSFIITDPSLQDNPIVFASDDFLNLTGYSREDVLGRNCRFLQGTDTSQAKVDEIRKGLANGDDISVTMVNYTADGTPFWNKLFIAALRDAQSNIVNFIGVVVKVGSPEPEDPEYGKKLPGEDEIEDDGAGYDSADNEGSSAADGTENTGGVVGDTTGAPLG
jgi:PAS domain S-box-containing protein